MTALLPRPLLLPLDLPAHRLVEGLAGGDDCGWLDSGMRTATTGRWSFLTLPPPAVLVAEGERLRVRLAGAGDGSGAARLLASLDGAPLIAGLEEAFSRLGLAPWPEGVEEDDGVPPFPGGLAGFLSYDLGRSFERIPGSAEDDAHVPHVGLAVADTVVAIDHDRDRAWLCRCFPGADPDDPAEREALSRSAGEVRRACAGPAAPRPPFRLVGPPRSDLSPRDYQDRVRRIRERIGAGDVYQVNLAQRLEAACEGDPLTAYRRLRVLSPAPYGAFLRVAGLTIASNSPERFLKVDGGAADSRPVKGTRPRLAAPAGDAASRGDLVASEKDRAELAMIVDLVRNDLGRVAVPGGVHVPCSRAIESYATVHHGVGDVRARLRPGTSPLDWLRATFPPGSVTGCPKVRALALIDALEPHRRGVYCGAIGYLSFTGHADMNVAIRTAMFHGGRVTLGVGGGVVWDSRPDEEYRESLVKAAAWLEALGGAGGVDPGALEA